MAIRKRKDRNGKWRYQARVHLGNGKYKALDTFDREGEALDAEAEWRLSEKEKKEVRTGAQWSAFFLEGYAERVKSSTLRQAQDGIKRWLKEFGSRSLTTIDPVEAEEWARKNKAALPPVVTMLNYAVKKGVLTRNPFSGLSKKGPGRKNVTPLTVDEVARLAEIAGDEHGESMRAFVSFMAYTGLRVSEAYALEWGDIDFKENYVTVSKAVVKGPEGDYIGLPKSNEKRQVVLLPEARNALLRLPRTAKTVFVGKRDNQRLSQGAMAYYWRPVEAVFGRKVNRHEFRHFCGHYLYVHLGFRDFEVAKQLGHNDGGKLVRELYGHGDVGALEEIRKRAYGMDSGAPPPTPSDGESGQVIPFPKAAGE